MIVAEQVRSVHAKARLRQPNASNAIAMVIGLPWDDDETSEHMRAIDALNEMGMTTFEVEIAAPSAEDLQAGNEMAVIERARKHVLDMTLWAAESLEFIGLPIVYYGIGWGAPAAAMAAASRPDLVTAVVAQSADLSLASTAVSALGNRLLSIAVATRSAARFATRWLWARVQGTSLLPKACGKSQRRVDMTPLADLLHAFSMEPTSGPFEPQKSLI